MLTDRFCLLLVFPFALGKIRSRASGVMAGEVNRKNTSSKKTMSVILLILNSGLTLFLPRRFILARLV